MPTISSRYMGAKVSDPLNLTEFSSTVHCPTSTDELSASVPIPCGLYHIYYVVQLEVRDGNSPEILLLLRIVFSILLFFVAYLFIRN